MYNDGVITTEFTGYYDSIEGEYVSPSAGQNFVIRFPLFYLSAADGDFLDSGVSFSSETGSADDITIGNAPAQVLSATMLNPNGLMEQAAWGLGKAYIGVVTGEATADTYSDYVCNIDYNGQHYGITANGTLHAGSVTYAAGGEPKAVVKLTNSTAYYYTTTGAYFFGGSSFSAAISNPFLEGKYANLTEPLGFQLDANLIPVVVNDIANNTKTTYTNVPMGVYDFSNVDAHGITFGVEAYDNMTLFDADATDWVASLDFTTPKTLTTILSELMTEMGYSGNYSVSASAVNTTLTYSENPITAYAVTYRQVLRWIAEAMGCNARMTRTGGVELYTYNSTSVQTITPDTILSNTRTKARYTVPQITEVVCYDTLGYNYSSGSSGVPYYIAANPFLTGLDQSVQPLTNICTLLRNVPEYYPSIITEMYADPRLDAGDFITINTTDGTTPYVVPVMRQTLNWNGVCKATLVASGNQTRAVPSDLIENNLSTTVNGRKILNGVDAKRITVLDENENVLFNADTETDEVQIAGFTVVDEYMDYVKEEDAHAYLPDKTNITTVHVGTDGIYHEMVEWYDTGVWDDELDDEVPTSVQMTRRERLGGDLGDGLTGFSVYEDTRNDPDNPAIYSGSWIGSQFSMTQFDGSGTQLADTKVDACGVKVSLPSGPQGIYAASAMTLLNATGNREVAITANGPTIDRGQGSTTVPTSTWTNLGSFSLTPGVWLIACFCNFEANATGRRAFLLSTTSGGSSAYVREATSQAVAVSGGETRLNFTYPYDRSSNVTIYLNAWQNSGSSLSASWTYDVVRLA